MTKKAKASPRKPAKISAATRAAAKSRKQAAVRAEKKVNGKLAAKAAQIPPAPAIASSIKVQLVPFGKIDDSALNPRKSRDPQKVTELAESIAQDGIQQPLKLRPHPRKSGRFEIVFGGSRRAAIALLVAAKRAPADYGVPAIVEDCSDAQLIKLALVENIQRADLSPLEEGEAFVKLRESGGSTEEVARDLGKSQRWVQQRIALVEKLAPEVKAALREGELTTWQAQAMCKGEPKHQVELLEQVRNGWLSSAADITERLTEEIPSVKVAHFPLKDYHAAGGELVEDDEGKHGPWFKDTALFEKLQREAIERTAAKLKEKWAWVKVISYPAGQHYSEWEWNKSKDAKKAGAVIVIEHDSRVAVHTGLVAKAAARTPAAKAAKKAAANNGEDSGPQITNALMVYAKNRKTEALQNAIAFGGENQGKAAMALACIALMGDSEVARIRPADISNEYAVVSPLVGSNLSAFRAPLEQVLEKTRRGKSEDDMAPSDLQLIPFGKEKDAAAAEAFTILWAMPAPSLATLFAGLVAAKCGTFNYFQPRLGDCALARNVAATLGVDMAWGWGSSQENWQAYLGVCRKSRLVRLVQHMPDLGIEPARAVGMKAGDLMDEILAALEANPDQRRIVPPELTFASEKEIEDAITRAGPAANGKAEKPAVGGEGRPSSAGRGKAKAARKGKAKPGELFAGEAAAVEDAASGLPA